VIVAHDGAAWLPRVMDALAKQTRSVQRVVAVDTGSTDRSGSMLGQAFGRAAVFGMDRTTGYGVAVAKALRHRSANAHVPLSGSSREDRTEWVWLLHDDSEPAPDALQRLLAGAREAPQAAVFGPKIMDWSDRGILLEAGTTIDRAGRRITGIEPREVDQGQHDGDRDVVAVSSAGMLVRRDVWDQVGGFDPGMRLFREDTDFCWRVQAAGYRVRVITGAVVYHVEAAARNRRDASASRRRRRDRATRWWCSPGTCRAAPCSPRWRATWCCRPCAVFFLPKRPAAAVDERAYTSVAFTRCAWRAVGHIRAGASGRSAGWRATFRPAGHFMLARIRDRHPVKTLPRSRRQPSRADDPSTTTRCWWTPAWPSGCSPARSAAVPDPHRRRPGRGQSLLGSTPLGGGALVRPGAAPARQGTSRGSTRSASAPPRVPRPTLRCSPPSPVLAESRGWRWT
jgi:GT2 family glycosyltransferase